MKERLKKIFVSSIICLFILSGTFFLPFEFSAIHEGWASDFWLFISNSGGTLGVPIITIVFCIIISLHYKGWLKKAINITISLIVFSIILGGFARFNEYFIKEKLKVERPNMKYLHSSLEFDIDTFYSFQSKTERREFLLTFLWDYGMDKVTFNNETLHPKVMHHWIEETGYSFPSGHSVNAFLMATLMAYIILFIYSDYRRRRWFVVPLLWATFVALSRNILGVHSAYDITLGALIGILAALLIIYTGWIEKSLTKKPSISYN